MWSPTIIETPPIVLLVDASRNLAGWESQFCDRLFTAMTRRGVVLVGSGPLRVDGPRELEPHLRALESGSCLLLVSHSGEGAPSAAVEMQSYVAWLKINVAGPKLLAVCSWQDYDPDLTEELLKDSSRFAPLALVQQSPVNAREAGLFFLKFFSELYLHSGNQISGRMTWFSWSKAKELLNRRRLEGKFGIRA
jgi:hypothetical protein